MADLHITWVDLFVAVVVIASMGFAIYRGLVKETLTIFAWAAAAFATLYFGRYVVPLMAPHFSPLLAQIVAYSAVFVLVLLPLSFIGHRMAQSVQNSPVGPMDRSLGAAFGVLRGLAVVAMIYIVFSLFVPIPVQKPWLTSARSLPVIQTSAKVLLSLLPSNQSQFVQQRTGKPAEAADRPQASSTQPKAEAAEESPSKPVKHSVHAAKAAHHRKAAQDVKLAHAATGPEPAPAAEKSASPAPQKTAAAAKKPASKGYGADDRRALNRLIESTGNGGGQ